MTRLIRPQLLPPSAIPDGASTFSGCRRRLPHKFCQLRLLCRVLRSTSRRCPARLGVRPLATASEFLRFSPWEMRAWHATSTRRRSRRNQRLRPRCRWSGTNSAKPVRRAVGTKAPSKSGARYRREPGRAANPCTWVEFLRSAWRRTRNCPSARRPESTRAVSSSWAIRSGIRIGRWRCLPTWHLLQVQCRRPKLPIVTPSYLVIAANRPTQRPRTRRPRWWARRHGLSSLRINGQRPGKA